MEESVSWMLGGVVSGRILGFGVEEGAWLLGMSRCSADHGLWEPEVGWMPGSLEERRSKSGEVGRVPS